MEATITKEQLRDEYLERVESLYEIIKEWMNQADPSAGLSRDEVDVREQDIAPYQAPVLVIDRQDCNQVRLLPRGRWIIGAEGRVDMKSDLGTETLVYVTEGGPYMVIQVLSESGLVLDDSMKPLAKDIITEGWVYVQNRHLGMYPALDAYLFGRLLEILSR